MARDSVVSAAKVSVGPRYSARLRKDMVLNKSLYLLALPVVLYYLLFAYKPMYGIVIAFKDYSAGLGIWKSPWVGLRHFVDFFQSIYFFRVLRNTVLLSLYSLICGFPAPIVLALLLNELRNQIFKRTIQTISYLPHFISLVVICGIVRDFTLSTGVINDLIAALGGERIAMLQHARYYRTIYVASGIWQNVGWGSIVYLAALSGIDPRLYEAAVIDGAGRWRQMWHITVPGMMPVVVIMLILSIGRLMSVGSQKTILLYNPSIYEVSDIISSYVYRQGLQQFNFSFSTAVNVFDSLVNLSLLYVANRVCRRLGGIGLW
jgi:putative aldouronate transport system permease protein